MTGKPLDKPHNHHFTHLLDGNNDYKCFCFRVINAGKSALNEDQACCEVVVARRRPMSYCPPSTPSRTPSAKRRNSLPNGEGLGLRLDYSKLGEVLTSD